MNLRVLGLDHRHAYGMTEGMIGAGARLADFWTEGAPQLLDDFLKRYPEASHADDLGTLLADPSLDLALIAARPDRRTDLAVQAMEAGLDVMVDKPGCIDGQQLDRLRDAVSRTGRIWSVSCSQRFEIPAATMGTRLVAEGAIGRVVNMLGLGPHRLNAATRPDRF